MRVRFKLATFVIELSYSRLRLNQNFLKIFIPVRCVQREYKSMFYVKIFQQIPLTLFRTIDIPRGLILIFYLFISSL